MSGTYVLRKGHAALGDLKDGGAAFGLLGLGGGNFYYVHDTKGNDSNDGTESDAPLATIDAAINNCTANQGDVVVVMPGHVETILNATTIVPDVAGITIIGMGIGRNRPTIKFNHATANLLLTGANMRLSNLIFKTTITEVAVALNFDADGIIVDNCLFDFESTGDNFIIGCDIDAVDFCEFNYNVYRAERASASGADNVIRLDDTAGVKIIGNYMTGDFDADMILGEDTTSTELLIVGNLMHNSDAGAGVFLDLHDSSTGSIANNSMFTLFTTDLTGFDPGNCFCNENYLVNDEDQHGAIVPAQVSA